MEAAALAWEHVLSRGPSGAADADADTCVRVPSGMFGPFADVGS